MVEQALAGAVQEVGLRRKGFAGRRRGRWGWPLRGPGEPSPGQARSEVVADVGGEPQMRRRAGEGEALGDVARDRP